MNEPTRTYSGPPPDSSCAALRKALRVNPTTGRHVITLDRRCAVCDMSWHDALAHPCPGPQGAAAEDDDGTA